MNCDFFKTIFSKLKKDFKANAYETGMVAQLIKSYTKNNRGQPHHRVAKSN